MGGILVITDFDTPTAYVRENKHNEDIVTYKADNSLYVKPFGYTLLEKRMYSHSSDGVVLDIQERISTQIFYKENQKDIYMQG